EQDAAVGAADEAHLGRSVLARAGLGHLAAELAGHHLEAVADAESRNPELEDAGVEVGRAGLVDARGSAREHDTYGVLRGELGGGDGVRHDLAVHARLAHAPRDELSVLGAEVDDEHGTLSRFAHALTSLAAGAASASVVAWMRPVM